MSESNVWLLGRRPALDGIRGIAIILVVVSHLSSLSSSVRQLGMIGVVVFFTLSGFLITSLLLEEQTVLGRIDLRSFYRRRFLRLAQAMLVCVAMVGLLGIVLGPSFAPLSLLLGAVTWSSNWVIATGSVPGTALTHTWSLAIEEQFYLVWPVLIVILSRLGRRWVVGVAVVGVYASLGLRFALVSAGEPRIYNGSDTRADSILIGCLLALAVHGRPERPSRPALAGIAGLAILFSSARTPALVVLVAPMSAAILTAALILWSATGEGVWWLSGRRLGFLGQRSYGVYLWHMPIIVLVNRLLADPGWVVLAMVALPLTAAATHLSWTYVEKPCLDLRSRGASKSDEDESGPGSFSSAAGARALAASPAAASG